MLLKEDLQRQKTKTASVLQACGFVIFSVFHVFCIDSSDYEVDRVCISCFVIYLIWIAFYSVLLQPIRE